MDYLLIELISYSCVALKAQLFRGCDQLAFARWFVAVATLA